MFHASTWARSTIPVCSNSLFTSTRTQLQTHTLQTIFCTTCPFTNIGHTTNITLTDSQVGKHLTDKNIDSHARPTLLTGTDRSVNGPPGNLWVYVGERWLKGSDFCSGGRLRSAPPLHDVGVQTRTRHRGSGSWHCTAPPADQWSPGWPRDCWCGGAHVQSSPRWRSLESCTWASAGPQPTARSESLNRCRPASLPKRTARGSPADRPWCACVWCSSSCCGPPGTGSSGCPRQTCHPQTFADAPSVCRWSSASTLARPYLTRYETRSWGCLWSVLWPTPSLVTACWNLYHSTLLPVKTRCCVSVERLSFWKAYHTQWVCVRGGDEEPPEGHDVLLFQLWTPTCRFHCPSPWAFPRWSAHSSHHQRRLHPCFLPHSALQDWECWAQLQSGMSWRRWWSNRRWWSKPLPLARSALPLEPPSCLASLWAPTPESWCCSSYQGRTPCRRSWKAGLTERTGEPSACGSWGSGNGRARRRGSRLEGQRKCVL